VYAWPRAQCVLRAMLWLRLRTQHLVLALREAQRRFQTLLFALSSSQRQQSITGGHGPTNTESARRWKQSMTSPVNVLRNPLGPHPGSQ
jgi:hypothetical protein